MLDSLCSAEFEKLKAPLVTQISTDSWVASPHSFLWDGRPAGVGPVSCCAAAKVSSMPPLSGLRSFSMPHCLLWSPRVAGVATSSSALHELPRALLHHIVAASHGSKWSQCTS